MVLLRINGSIWEDSYPWSLLLVPGNCDFLTGGSGGKGTWGGMLDIDTDPHLDPSDPNYDSNEVSTVYFQVYICLINAYIMSFTGKEPACWH